MPSDAKPNFDIAREKFKEWYSNNYNLLNDAANKYKNLISDIISSDESIEKPNISFRIKEKGGCIDKFRLKYMDDLEEVGEKYDIQDHITDIIGIRVVCYYEEDIEKIGRLISDEFKVISRTDKSKNMEDEDNKFGYKGLHLDIQFSNKRKKLKEYKSASSFRAEVQIRTIVQHAWSEIDHKLNYKRDLPMDLRRRIYRLSALFELADKEFEGIKKDRESYLKLSLSEKILDSDPLTSIKLLKIMREYFPSYPFEEIKIEGFCDEIRGINEDITVGEFRRAMEAHFERVKEYRSYVSAIFGRNLNPYTMVRHVLYRHKTTIYDGLLIERFRNNFNRWDVEGYVLKD